MTLFINIIGFIAAGVGTSIMLPQLIKTIRIKRAEDVSIVMSKSLQKTAPFKVR